MSCNFNLKALKKVAWIKKWFLKFKFFYGYANWEYCNPCLCLGPGYNKDLSDRWSGQRGQILACVRGEEKPVLGGVPGDRGAARQLFPSLGLLWQPDTWNNWFLLKPLHKRGWGKSANCYLQVSANLCPKSVPLLRWTFIQIYFYNKVIVFKIFFKDQIYI